ncbi:hypothetical protein A2U01_0099625 [Trifolium medium]|uniref:Uncharacterized protein n=1 Tax=Trifolium medium TaxID=97028 RepID=A0A392UUE6_9FABA|nr:hypothetical protein [Trifolium medium]
MTPQDFHSHNNWPGDRPHFGGESGAGADAGDDDEEVDEAAANAFVDEEEDASD